MGFTHMIPIVQEDVTKINIVIGTCGAIDQNSTEQSVPGLDVEVRMIPASTILDRTPRVGQRIARGNRALSNTRSAIHLVCPILANSVEVYTRAVVLEGVGHMNNCDPSALVHDAISRQVVDLTDGISPIGYDRGTWIRAIDQLSRYFNTVWCDCSVLDIKPVLPNHTCVGHIVIVVGREIVAVAPARSIRGTINA